MPVRVITHRVPTKTGAGLIEYLSPPFAFTNLGRQDDIMTIAGRQAGFVWVLSMSHFSLLFFRRFRRQDVRHGNAVQQCNGLQISGMFWPQPY